MLRSLRQSLRAFSSAPFNKEILNFVVCPVSKGPLTIKYQPDENGVEQAIALESEQGMTYPIVDGVAHLFPPEN